MGEISLNVLGIRNSIKRRSIFTYLKDQNATFYFFYRKHILNRVTSHSGEAKFLFPMALATEKELAYY